MALLDISIVTEALIDLIESAFNAQPLDNLIIATPSIFPAPPAHLEETGIGMYLYHIAEDAHYKNLPPPGRDPIPVRYTPMGLNLYYHLSANDDETTTSANVRALNEQKMMSIALKALRDNPEINVSVAGTDNRLKIILNPIPPNEAITFWTAGSSAVKLSTYYEVSVALLEPLESTRLSGRVLAYGVHTFVHGAPRIIGSENTLAYTPPGTTESRELKASPAQVPFDHPFRLMGTGFGGSELELLLIDPSDGTILVADLTWQIAVHKDTLSAVASRIAIDQESGLPVALAPGIYGAQISVTRRRRMPDGQERDFVHLSNQIPISIAPSILSLMGIAPNSTIFLVTGFAFTVPTESIRVYVGDVQLILGADYNALAAGEFAVNPVAPINPDDDTEMRIHIPPASTTGDYLPVRIFIHGIESEPAWIQVP